MGSVDKGLRELRGKPMVRWVLERFMPQVGEIIINANQNLDIYARFRRSAYSSRQTIRAGLQSR